MLIFLSCEKFVFAHKVYNNSDHVLVYFFFFPFDCAWHAESWFPDQELNPCFLHWECRVLTTGLWSPSAVCLDTHCRPLLGTVSSTCLMQGDTVCLDSPIVGLLFVLLWITPFLMESCCF